MSAPAQPLGVREILDAPVQLIRAHFRALILVALAGEALAAVPILVYQAVSGGETPDLTAPSELGRFLVLTYGAVGAQWLVRILPTLALYEAVRRLLDGEPVSVGEAYAAALDPRSYFTYVLRGALVGAGFLLCGVPGVIAACLFALLGPALVHEGLGWTGALQRSYELVWDNPSGRLAGSTLSAVLIAGVVFTALSFAINTIAALPGTVWTMVEVFSSASQGAAPTAYVAPAWLVLIGSGLGVVAQSVVDLYPAAVFTLIYREARRRREGGDIEAALKARLGEEPGG